MYLSGPISADKIPDKASAITKYNTIPKPLYISFNFKIASSIKLIKIRIIFSYIFLYVFGLNNINIGNNSRRPAIISRDNTTLEKLENIE